MSPRECWLVLRATIITMLDSERTEQIHLVEELTGCKRYATCLAQWRDDPDVQKLLVEQPELRSDQVDFDALRALPAESLGFQYIDHLDRNGVTADSEAAPTTQIADPEMASLMRRFRQTHDVWHALTGLGTSGHEEVLIHAFSWGQLRLPVSAMVVGFGTLKHIIGDGRWAALRHGLGEAYEIGRDADPLLPVY